MRGSGSVKPSPPGFREPARILDMINLEPEPGEELEVEESEIVDKMLGVLCKTWRGTRDGMSKCFGSTIQLELLTTR